MENKTIDEYLSQPQKDLVIYNCEDCGKHIEKSGKVFRRNPHLKCKACYMKSKYGVTSNLAKPEVRQRAFDNILKTYGTYENFTKIRLDKAKKATFEKYGVENIWADKEINKKAHANKDYKQEAITRAETNIKNYGSACIGKSSHIYKGMIFDSSWELAFWIWCEDNNKQIERNNKPIKLKNGKNIYPDFLVDGVFYEIKGDHLTKKDDWGDRSEAYLRNNVKVLFGKDMIPILKYIYTKYGKEYLKKFRKKRKGQFKRTPTELNEKTKRHHRIHYICKNCGRDVFITKRLHEHFNDMLCKYCRKFASFENQLTI